MGLGLALPNLFAHPYCNIHSLTNCWIGCAQFARNCAVYVKEVCLFLHKTFAKNPIHLGPHQFALLLHCPTVATLVNVPAASCEAEALKNLFHFTVTVFAHPTGGTFTSGFARHTFAPVQAGIEFALLLGETLDHHLASC